MTCYHLIISTIKPFAKLYLKYNFNKPLCPFKYFKISNLSFRHLISMKNQIRRCMIKIQISSFTVTSIPYIHVTITWKRCLMIRYFKIKLKTIIFPCCTPTYAVRRTSRERYINNLDHNFTVIGISESWFKEHNVDRYGIESYTFRPIRSGGGVSIFVQHSIEYFVRTYLSYLNAHIETIFIEIDKEQIGKDKKCNCRSNL